VKVATQLVVSVHLHQLIDAAHVMMEISYSKLLVMLETHVRQAIGKIKVATNACYAFILAQV